MDPHPLAVALRGAAIGEFPPVDGRVEIVRPDRAGTQAIVEFAGHAFVLTDRSPDDPLFAGVDAYGGAGHPRFVIALAGGGGVIGSHDVVLVGRGGSTVRPLPATDLHDDHPRVVRARTHRVDVSVVGDERGLVTIGSGLVGRTELSVEVIGSAHGAGVGRALIQGGLALVPDDEWVFAQVAPGNASSLRAFLASGFVPICSEILIKPEA